MLTVPAQVAKTRHTHTPVIQAMDTLHLKMSETFQKWILEGKLDHSFEQTDKQFSFADENGAIEFYRTVATDVFTNYSIYDYNEFGIKLFKSAFAKTEFKLQTEVSSIGKSGGNLSGKDYQIKIRLVKREKKDAVIISTATYNKDGMYDRNCPTCNKLYETEDDEYDDKSFYYCCDECYDNRPPQSTTISQVAEQTTKEKKTPPMTKSMLCEIIAFHFRKKNQRLTNLSKNTLPQLNEQVKKHNINIQLIQEEMLADKLKAQEELKQKEEEARVFKELIKTRAKALWKNKAMWIDAFLKFKFGKVIEVTDEERLKRADDFFVKMAQGKPFVRTGANQIRIGGFISVRYSDDVFDFTEEARQKKIEYFSTEEGFEKVVEELYKKDSKIPRHTIVHHGDGTGTLHFLKGFNKHL
jgi:hypothetical protein